MTNLSSHPNLIKLEARDATQLETMLSEIEKAYSVIAIYGMNNRHYAWISLHTGLKKRVVKSKVRSTDAKREKVKIK